MVEIINKIETELNILQRCRDCIEQNEPYDSKAVKREIQLCKKNISSLIMRITPIKPSSNNTTDDVHQKILQLELLCDGANKVHRSLILDKKNAKNLKKVERTILELNEKLDLLRRHAKQELDQSTPVSIRKVEKPLIPISGELHIRVTGLFGLPKDTPHKSGRCASEYFNTKTSLFKKYQHLRKRNTPDDFIIVVHVGGSNVATVAWNEKKTMYGGDEKVINLRKCGQLEFEVYYTDSRSLCAFGVMPLNMIGDESSEEALVLTTHKKVELFPRGILHCQTVFQTPEERKRKHAEDACCMFNPISSRRNASIMSRRAQFHHSHSSVPRNVIETLNCYEMKKLIGIGAFGSVHLAVRKADKLYCAVKEVKRRPNEKFEMNELQVLKEVSHPFICNLISNFQENGNIYIVMEFCEAGDLHSHLANTVNGFSMPVIEYFAASIVLAVEYLHEKLYVHRDLKTENMMLTRRGHLRIIDFGLCKRLKTRNETMTEIVGTTTHFSAEIHRREEYGIDTDWYAVGVSLYQLRTRELPFHDFRKLQMTKNTRVDEIYAFKDLLVQLMTQYRQARLGYYDSNDVRKHPFFTETNFDDIYLMKMTPPYLPDLTSGVDLRYFPEDCYELLEDSSSDSSLSFQDDSSISHL